MPLHFAHTALKARATGTADNPDPSACIAAWTMESAVSGDSKEFKVFKSVVRPDAVAVVDVFIRSQSAADTSFHDQTVFKHVAIIDTNRDVSI
jgi:hypothetical protein